MRFREIECRELILENYYISIWKLVGMLYEICNLIYCRGIEMIKDLDIIFLI